MIFSPVERRRLYHEIAEQIEKSIRDGSLAPGSELPSERQLMESFAVGRPAVREAMLSLQQKGLISINNGERARVVHPDADSIILALSSAAAIYIAKPQGVRDFQAARQIFEISLAREAARIATDADVARIEAALLAGREAIGDHDGYGAADVDFHLQIVRTADNPLVTGLHQALSQWLYEQRAVSLNIPGAAESAQAYHERIFEAIRDHDPDRAEAAMREHLNAVSDFFWAGAGDDGQGNSEAPC